MFVLTLFPMQRACVSAGFSARNDHLVIMLVIDHLRQVRRSSLEYQCRKACRAVDKECLANHEERPDYIKTMLRAQALTVMKNWAVRMDIIPGDLMHERQVLQDAAVLRAACNNALCGSIAELEIYSKGYRRRNFRHWTFTNASDQSLMNKLGFNTQTQRRKAFKESGRYLGDHQFIERYGDHFTHRLYTCWDPVGIADIRVLQLEVKEWERRPENTWAVLASY
jgi:hypothetical protein